MGVFRSIVQSFVLPMLHARQDLAFGGSIALQFIGDDHAWDVLESFEELAKKAFRRVCVASALHQDIEHVAVLINGSPEIMRFPVDLQIHAHPGAIYHRSEGDDGATRWRTFAQISNTIAERFHSSRQLLVARRPLFHITRN